MLRGLASFVLVLGLGAPGAALADEFPTIASDGLFVGARLEPGGALLLGYDLDVYLTGDRVLSLGPAVTFSFLGDDGAQLGRRQDWLLTIDFLRLKVAVNDGTGQVRPYLSLGGGMTYASLPVQESGPHMVVLSDGTLANASLRYSSTEDFGGQISAGVGADFYLVDNLGIALAIVTHLRLSQQDRLPLFWAEVMIGLRFGL